MSKTSDKPAAKKYQLKNTELVFEVAEVVEDTTINTQYGPALITAGNFIVTDSGGNTFGITAVDLDLQYDAVKTKAAKK